MNIDVCLGALATLGTPCLVLGVFEGELSPTARQIDQACEGRLSQLLERGDLTGAASSTLLLYSLPNVAADRVLLVGGGAAADFNRLAYEKQLKTAFAALDGLGLDDALCTLHSDAPAEVGDSVAARAAVVAAMRSTYRYLHTKKPKPTAHQPLAKLTLWARDPQQVAALEQAAGDGQAMGAGINWARDLGNLPGNICTPTYLAEQALGLGQQQDRLAVEVLDEDAMAELGMGALLSVARGSREPAKLIVLHYRGAAETTKPIVLVGKGLTFDAGGISLKPAAEMDEMKYDMCGGAAVLGTLHAVAALGLPLNLIGVVAASENLPDGAANKPGDIVTSMSGQTIEILNTDAEGRLLLCDALTYCERFDPELVIDLATLTGACVVALGRHASGLFTADETLATELIDAGISAADRAWRFPLWPDYDSQLDSNFADMANIGGREGGAITAAAFLARFTKKFTWAHLDIAGAAWISGKEKGATGRPVGLLVEFLLRRSKQVST